MKLILALCGVFYVCNAQYDATEIKHEMSKLIDKIKGSTQFSRASIGTAFLARGVFNYLGLVKRCGYSELQLNLIAKYIKAGEEFIATDKLIQFYNTEDYLWAGDFMNFNTLDGLTVSSNSPIQVNDLNNSEEFYIKCLSETYEKNKKLKRIAPCTISNNCWNELIRPAWIIGNLPVDLRNRYYLFVKHQLRCSNLDTFWNVQVKSQLEIVLSEINTLKVKGDFQSKDIRKVFGSKLLHSAMNGFKEFVADDMIQFVLDTPGLCGAESDSDLDRVTFQLRCYAILAIKYRLLLD